LGFVTVIVAMELPLSATTGGLKLLVMTAEAACAKALPAKEALMIAAVTIARRDEFIERGFRDHHGQNARCRGGPVNYNEAD